MTTYKPKRITTLTKVVSTSLLLFSVPAFTFADDSPWSCRVSQDGSSWDCYKDGNLVIQPMPQTTPKIKSVPENTPVVEVPAETPQIHPLIESKPTQSEGNQPKIQQSSADTLDAKSMKTETTAKVLEKEVTSSSLHTKTTTQEKPAPQTENSFSKPLGNTTQTTVKTPKITQNDTPKKSETKSEIEPDIKSEVKNLKPTKTATPTYCHAQTNKKSFTLRQSTNHTDNTIIDADDALMNNNTGIAEFSGDVQLTNNKQNISSDTLRYDSNTTDIQAQGNIQYKRPDLAFQAHDASINLDTEKGEANQLTYQIIRTHARGTADKLTLKGNGISVYENTSYSTCPQGKDDWIFHAEQIELDQNTGVGTAKKIKVFFKDVQIASLPWATFPIDDRRKSGFLIPSIGSTESTGADISVPYYFNLAPQYDATFTPRIMSKRGVLLGGELRYKNEHSQLQFNGELLPRDDDYINNDPRGAASYTQSTSFNDRLSAALNLNYVSDNTYREDIGNSLAITSTQHLERTASLHYQGNHYQATALVQKYQTIDNTIAKTDFPYQKLPQITLTGSRDLGDSNFTGDLDVQYTYFDHDVLVRGGRFDLSPSLSYDWRRSWGFLKPKINLRYTSYDLDNQVVGQPTSIDRSTQTFSLDGGLFFERNTSWFGHDSTQTLEPRFFYVYTPEENQSNIPLFDSSTYSFNNASLFRENRFSGADRIADANQVTLALTSRFIDQPTSQEYLAMTLGQIFYFEDRKVQLTGSTPSTNDTSSFIATVNSKPAPHWLADAGLQWDNNFKNIEKSSLRIKYQDEQKHLFSARYQYDSAAKLDYTKLSVFWPIAFNTNLVAHSYYSLEENRAIETVAGIEHGDSCCWRFRALIRDYQINAAQDSNLSLLFQLELSGLTKLGNDIDSFLEQTIDGFTRN